MYVERSVLPFGEFVLAEPSPRRPLRAAFCITLYNERLAFLLKTLRSLLRALRYRHATTGTPYGACVCLVLDGIEKADPDLLAWLAATGLTRPDAMLRDGCEYHVSDHSLGALARQIEVGEGDEAESADAVQIVLCLKRRNRGKLHSHAVFFRDLCAWLQPEHCYQIDVGTTIAGDAIARLSTRLDSDPECAAIAPRVLIEAPSAPVRFLPAWQYVDFVMQKAVFWPFEVATGHLGVIPGQFCVFRWSALRGDGVGCFGVAEDAPLHAYLRGMSSHKPLERVMYLAEDRVMGGEIVIAPRRIWRLRYAADVVATTDACVSMGELFRQRRRWHNSTLACRAWLFAAWPGLLRRRDRPARNKIKFSLAMLGQLLLTVRDLTAPAYLACSALALSKIVASSQGAAGAAMQIGLCAALALAVLLSIGGPLRSTAAVSGARVIAGWSVYALLAGACLLVLPLSALVVLFTPVLISQGAMLRLARGEPKAVLANMQVFALTNLVMTSCLSAYAIWNLHDVSWGTKGLTTLKAEDQASRRLVCARWVAVSVWIGLNIALVVAGCVFGGATSPLLNPVFEAECAVTAVVTLIAVLGEWRNRGRTR